MRTWPHRAAGILCAIAIGVLSGCGGRKSQQADASLQSANEGIQGTATYRERILLPPNAIFEATLQDVSMADAPATAIARTTLSKIEIGPIPFTIPFDPAKIDSRHAYSVRATIMIDGELWFTSDTGTPVLTHGAGNKVDILLRMVKGDAPDSSGLGAINNGAQALGLRLPATFRGDLPCADCPAVRYHLDLWPDTVFHLHREWLGKNRTQDRIGHWQIDPAAKSIKLFEVDGETPVELEVTTGGKLTLLDSAHPAELVSDGALVPTDLTLAMCGEITYWAKVARFTECLSGRSYPIAAEGEFEKLQQAYLKDVQEPGAPLFVTIEGSITGHPKDGAVERIVTVNRFIHTWPNQKCAQNRANASLTNTYWRIYELQGEPLVVANEEREPHLTLKATEQKQSYAATVGCNQLVGSYSLEGDHLVFGRGAATAMACSPPYDVLEKRLADVLAKTQAWTITGQTLELRDAQGSSLALLEAVYF
jgi:uncharacterized lipoprotein YbaY/heat shock protein HslJ